MIKLTIALIVLSAGVVLSPYIKDTVKNIIRDFKDTAYGRTNKIGGDVAYRPDLDTGINPTGRLKDHPGISNKIADWVSHV